MDSWNLIFDLVLLLLSALVLGAVAEQLKQSAIVGFLLAGMLLGPNALQWVQSDSEVEIFAELGVALLLFAIGLDASDNTDQWLGSIRVIDNGFTSSSGSGGAGPRRYDTAFGKTIHYEFLDSTDDARAEVRVSVR